VSVAKHREERSLPKCVYRTDLRQQPVSELLSCVDVSEIFHCCIGPTIEECVQMLVAHDEICLGRTDKRHVMKGPRLVGYIRIVDLVG
jgi:hypothetical protein